MPRSPKCEARLELNGITMAITIDADWEPVEILPLPELTADELQIWRVDLPHPDAPPEDYFPLLSGAEQTRAERLRMGRVRLQFVVARAALRVLLGHALSVDPTLVAITPSGFGKPETPAIFYNIAHSGAVILIALCRNHSVGIDVEYLNRDVDALEIAKSSFSASEYRALAAIDKSEDLHQAFHMCWTRKEAILKADGRGLSLSLDSFDVPVGPTADLVPVVLAHSEESAVREYYVSDISMEDGVAAAYAITVPQLPVRQFSLGLRTIQKA